MSREAARTAASTSRWSIFAMAFGVAACGSERDVREAPASVGHRWVRDIDVETLDELQRRLSHCESSPCPQLVYVWSPTMQLSVEARPEIVEAAQTLDIPLSVIPAEVLHDGPEPLRRALVDAGATVHFPSVVLFNGTVPQSNAVVGYKEARAYETLLRPRVAALAAGSSADAPSPIGTAASVLPAGTDPAPRSATPDRDIRIVWRLALPTNPGAFFRRVPDTRYISYDIRRRVYLHHLETGEQIGAPGFIDFVPTPDGALFVTPAEANAGLEFYIAREVLDRGRKGEGRRVAPVYVDPQLADQYPSIGILATDPGRRTRYRILVSWFEGLAVRDYEAVWNGPSSVRITPQTPKIHACPGLALSTPMLSKDGQEIAARDETTATTKVFRLAPNGRCREVLDLGRQTSKVAFSDDGVLLAYSSPNARNTGSTTYVLNRRTGRTTAIPESESFGLVIPEVVGPDSLLLLARPRVRSGFEFRLHCCVR